MRIAIYSRKSKWTGKGESIENQLIMCKEYIKANFIDIKDENIFEYEDEGFSGKNTQRPQFIKMMSDMKEYHFDCLVCYKLDRLGRNLSDLVNLIDDINKMGISFISIKEKFDTSTPIGRAMMFFTGVLAQMEREQIAERVRDNMLMLARSGKWLGGTTPLGFISKKNETKTWNNKIKTSYRLNTNEQELKIVEYIFYDFLEKQSLSQLEKYFLQNGIKTRTGKDYQISSLRDILTNPVYCTADHDAYQYFIDLGCQVCVEENDWDGTYGLLSYGKTSSGKYKNQQISPVEWIVAVSKHKGIIKGCDWIKVQQILERNKKKGDNYRKIQNPVSLLSGVVYCSCGYPMRPKNYSSGKMDEMGSRIFAYICSQKEKTNGTKCNVTNVNGNLVDKMVYNEVLRYVKLDNMVYTELEKRINNLNTTYDINHTEREMLKEILTEKKSEIQNFLHSFGKSDGQDVFLKYIQQQVERLDRDCTEIERKINDLSPTSSQTENGYEINLVIDQISSFSNVFLSLSVIEKREYLRMVIDRVIWDGENIDIIMSGK